MSDFNLKVTVRNAHLLRAIRERFPSAAAFARAAGISQSHIAALVTMRESPLRKSGALTFQAQQICDFLGKNFEELWPGQLSEIRRKKATHEIEMSAGELAQIADPTRAALQRKMLAQWATDLRPREMQALALRIDGATLTEAGAAMGVSQERFRQIEAKALRKMREAAARQGIKRFHQVAE